MESQAFRIIDVLNNKIVINEVGMSKIKLVKGKIYPISMVGPMLTGKSSLINNLIGKQVFQVGSTTRSTTRGVNCYLQQLKMSKNEVWIAYLDIQGFDDPYNEGGQEIDKSLLSLIMSTSYLLLYNSFGALDSKIFSRIAHVRDSLDNSSEIVFIQRDFSLKLINSEKEPLSSQEYLQRCISSFQQKQKDFKDSKIFKDKLKCFLFPNHGDCPKYQSKLVSLKTSIHEKISVCWANENSQKNSIKYLIKSFEIGVGLITQNKDLSILQKAIQSQLQNEQKSMTALFKTQVSQKVKKEIKPMFPMPEQLLTFKFNKVSQQILEGFGISMIYTNQVMGEKNLEEINKKILGKLLEENEVQRKNFIVGKIESILQCEPNKSYKNNDEDDMFQSLVDYHPFITENHRSYFMFQLFRNLYKRTLQQSKQNKKIVNAQSKNMSALQQELKENTQVLKEKQQIIEDLKQKVRGLEGQVKMMKLKLEQSLQENIPSFKQCILEPKKRFSFQQRVQDHEKTFDQGHDIINVEQKRNKEKITVLQKENKGLKGELENYVGGNCVQTVLKNYNESIDKIQQKDRQMRDLCKDKDKAIQNLKEQNSHIKSINSSLNKQVSILRDTTKDRTKTSHILQKLLKSKQVLLQQTQSQLLSNMSKYKEQLNNQRLQNQCREMELSKQLSTFIIKNQDLITRNGDLESKINQCEHRVKKQYDDKMEEKANEISNLHKQLIECSKKLQQKTEECLEYSVNVSNVLKSKENEIKQMQLSLQKREKDLLFCEKQIERLKNMNEQKCVQLTKLELSKEQLECKINRQQALANNKIKYIQHTNQKLKCQIKQKENTFDLMLLQLRSNSLINNSLTNKNLLNEQRKERYMKKIDHLQEIALRQLDDISNYSLSITKGEKRQRQSFGGNRPIRQLEFGDMNHLQVRSKYETDRKPRRSEIVKSNHTGETSLLRNNLNLGHTMSTSSGFKTIAKRF